MAAASTVVRLGRWAGVQPAAAREARLRLLIAGGGDDRIWLDPATRRNRYGVPASPAPDELWFSSSTASAISPRGWAAADQALDRLIEPGRHTIDAYFDTLRRRLLALYGAPGAEAVLAASGTEAELVTLCLALSLANGPIANIVVAAAETGSGCTAALSRHSCLERASLCGPFAKATRLAGWEDGQVALDTIEIRLP